MAHNLFNRDDHAVLYGQYRPSPPKDVVSVVLDFLNAYNPRKGNNKWSKAIDVGCGSGQLTKRLADDFEQVVGYDISEAQIKVAVTNNKCSNITFKVRYNKFSKITFLIVSHLIVTGWNS